MKFLVNRWIWSPKSGELLFPLAKRTSEKPVFEHAKIQQGTPNYSSMHMENKLFFNFFPLS